MGHSKHFIVKKNWASKCIPQLINKLKMNSSKNQNWTIFIKIRPINLELLFQKN
jgi:hypothetical protein